ncbi:MAG: hypothetical protein ACRDHK_09525 [Actinomycetota bacterium]
MRTSISYSRYFEDGDTDRGVEEDQREIEEHLSDHRVGEEAHDERDGDEGCGGNEPLQLKAFVTSRPCEPARQGHE